MGLKALCGAGRGQVNPQIKSDQNGIESPIGLTYSRRCTRDKIRPKWD